MEPLVVVFAPAPLLTITVERRGDEPDIHLHAGGQGFWQARMVTSLGIPVVICATFGGEVGTVVRTLIEQQGMRLRAVESTARNVAYIHDRRSGRREPFAEMAAAPLTRHDLDELYSVTIVEATRASACLLGGPPGSRAVEPSAYERLAKDLRAAGVVAIADLTGEELRAALRGGLSLLKMSHEEMVEEGWARSDSVEDVVAGMRALQREGAERVIVSHANEPVLALADSLVQVRAPQFHAVEPRGGGDSITAGVTASLARGDSWERALKVGAAAGALNVVRRGLATGAGSDIEVLAEQVEVEPVQDEGREERSTTPDELAARARPA